MLALFARIMSYPLRHDEQFYLPAGQYLNQWSLYQDINFTHLPNLPLLLNAIFALTGIESELLVGRLLVFGVWMLACYALYATARFAGCANATAGLLASMLALNPLLLGPAGMLVTNNFIPVPFALLGLLLFLKGCGASPPSIRLNFLSGICLSLAIGFKANYVFLVPPIAIASLLVPPGIGFRMRMMRVTLPVFLGAMLAGLPALHYFASDPMHFLAHVVSFHQSAHVEYWMANSADEGPVALSWVGKMLLAQNVWLAGGTLLIFLLALTLAITAVTASREDDDDTKSWWPVILAAGLVVGAGLVSFLPTPAFPQYYAPPIAFGLVLCALLYGRLIAAARSRVTPVMAAVFLLTAAGALPILAPDLPALARPSKWTGNSVDRAADNIGWLMARQPGNGRLLTLAPIYPAEAGLPLYKELALGPFIYRAADHIPAENRPFFRDLVSPRTLEQMLARTPPKAILVGLEERLDQPLEVWAIRNAYRPVPVALGDKRKKFGKLYLAPISATGPAR
ncbi:hypothetical protein [Sphingopyxis kveilinensis]|uniref:hypothetical protein n=1 Tax=Sphingopyxis kveilinensis TaxID=3114367 RepID=UPI0030D30276